MTKKNVAPVASSFLDAPADDYSCPLARLIRFLRRLHSAQNLPTPLFPSAPGDREEPLLLELLHFVHQELPKLLPRNVETTALDATRVARIAADYALAVSFTWDVSV